MAADFSSLKKGPQPHASLACQDLLSTGDVCHSGTLKKKLTTRKRSSFFGTILGKFPWADRYVVLSNGSLYHYHDHQGRRPSGAYSLFGYNQVMRAGDIPHSKYPWAFKIVHINDSDRTKYFATGSEWEMKTWLTQIRSQLVIANGSLLSQSNISPSASVADDDLEKPIYSPTDELTNKLNGDDEDSDADDYVEIEEDKVGNTEPDPPNRPLPKPPISPSSCLPSSRRESSNPPPMILNQMVNLGYGQDDEPPQLPEERPAISKNRAPIPTPDACAPAVSSNGHNDKPWNKNRTIPQPPSARKKSDAQSPDHSSSSSPNCAKAVKFGVKMFPDMESPGFIKPPVPIKPNKPKPPQDASPTLPATPPRTRSVPAPPAQSQSLRWTDAHWNGVDKQVSEQIIRNIAVDGVYMIRESDKPGCVKTLVCFLENDSRKFMIKQNGEGYFINLHNTFNSIDQLLEFYHKHNLPNRNGKLVEPYTKHTRDRDSL